MASVGLHACSPAADMRVVQEVLATQHTCAPRVLRPQCSRSTLSQTTCPATRCITQAASPAANSLASPASHASPALSAHLSDVASPSSPMYARDSSSMEMPSTWARTARICTISTGVYGSVRMMTSLRGR